MNEKISLLKNVYYFDGNLWYQVDCKSRNKLVNNNGELKTFIVIDVTQEIVYTKEQYLEKYFPDSIPQSKEVLQKLNTLKFKVFKLIKLKSQRG